MKIHILAILALFTINVQAQIDKHLFEEIFNEETISSKYLNRDNHSATFQNTPAQKVPNWFFNPPGHENNGIYAIGISDPNMDTTLGFEMAVQRAQAMANIMFNGTTQLLCDFFLNEIDQSQQVVFEHFSRINTKIPNVSNFEVVETFRNEFGETIVLIHYFPSPDIKSTGHQLVKCEIYKNEIETSANSEFESIYEMISNSSTEPTDTTDFYQLTEFGKRYDVVSSQNHSHYQVPIYSLKYSGLPSSDSASIQYFSHGLWKEYFKAVIMHITGVARLKPENIKHLGASYQRENFEKLVRGVSVNKMRFVLKSISSKNNELQLELKELPLAP